jgi:putative tryptophan/tyrosine transport system substrate-binding protein
MNKKLVWLTTLLFIVAATFAEAKQPTTKIPRIGIIGAESAARVADRMDALRQGLRELGYNEGHNIAIEYRWAHGHNERLPGLASDLVQLNVDAIFVSGGTPGVLAAKNATSEIPIVFVATSDPVATGIVASLARPGGNITGLTIGTPGLWGKRLELLKETIPRISCVGLLLNPVSPASNVGLKESRISARSLGLHVQPLEIRSLNDIDTVFETGTRQAGALNVIQQPPITSYRNHITELTIKRRLPAMYSDREWPEDANGLMSYGPNFSDLYRRSASYLDKILKGTKPADLPVEQPMKFEFVINLMAAKQIGLTIPPNVLARADRVIR